MLLFINFELIWGAWGRELYKRNLFVTRGGPKRSTARERQTSSSAWVTVGANSAVGVPKGTSESYKIWLWSFIACQILQRTTFYLFVIINRALRYLVLVKFAIGFSN